MLWKQRAGLGRSRLRLHLVVQVTISAKPEGQAGNGDIDKADRHRPWAQETKSDGKSSLSHNTHKGGFTVPFASSFTLSEALDPRTEVIMDTGFH